MRLSIIIPVYNEEKTVGVIINKVKNLELPIEKEIIVVDDGSKDKSYEIAKKIKGIRLLRHEKNKGKGAAVKTGLKNARGDIVIIQDADLELDPEQIPKIIQPIIEKKADVVYGSRELEGDGKKRSPLFYFGGKFVTFLTNLLYKTRLTDEPCGYKAFRTEILKSIKIDSDRFEWEPEVTAKIAKRKIMIYEVPVSSTSRSTEEGKKLKRRDGLKAVLTLLKYKFVD